MAELDQVLGRIAHEHGVPRETVRSTVRQMGSRFGETFVRRWTNRWLAPGSQPTEGPPEEAPAQEAPPADQPQRRQEQPPPPPPPPPHLLGSRSLHEVEGEWERVAAASRLIPPTMDAHFGQAHAEAEERARQLQEPVDMQAWAVAQQMAARRYVPIFGGPPPATDHAQMVYDATVDDGNVSSASSHRDFASPRRAQPRVAAPERAVQQHLLLLQQYFIFLLLLILRRRRPTRGPQPGPVPPAAQRGAHAAGGAADALRGVAAPFVIPAGVAAEVIEALMRQFHGARSQGAAITYLRQQDHPPVEGEGYRPERRRSGRSGGAARPALVA